MNAVVVEVLYDPFRIATSVKINGEPSSADSDVHRVCRDRRLQEWVDEFLQLMRKKTASRKMDFIFKGLPLDAEDLRSAIDEYNKANEGAEFCLREVIQPDGPEGSRVEAMRELYESAKQGPCKKLFVKDMAEPFKRALDPTFEVDVLGTMSSGKSMLINALLGRKLLYSDPESATSAVTRIEQVDAEGFRVRRFDADGKVLDRWRSADFELLKKWTSVSGGEEQAKQIEYVQIQGPFPAVPGREESRLVIVDTPGPNSAIHLEHGNITAKVIRNASSSMVFYVLNASQLGTKDDESLLIDVCAAIERGGRRTRDQFVFLVNKIDERMTCAGAVLKALQNVRKYLADHGIRNPIVIPCSSQLALFARLIKANGNLDQWEARRWNGLKELFGLVTESEFVEQLRESVGSSCLQRITKRLKDADELTKLEILSGIPVVEEVLNDYLCKYAIPTRLRESVEAFEVLNQDMAVASELTDQLEKKEEALQDGKNALSSFLGELEGVAKGLDFQKELDAWKYELSLDANKRLVEFAENATQVADRWVGKFNERGKVSKEIAENLVEQATRECRKADAIVVQELGTELGKEFRRVFESFSGKYKSYIEDVLKRQFPGDPAMQKFARAALCLPSVETFIKDNKHDESRQEYDHREWDPSWNPLTWLRFKPVYRTVTEVKVDLSTSESKRFLENLRTTTLMNIEQFKRTAVENSEMARQTFRESLKQVQSRLLELVGEIKKERAHNASKSRLLKLARTKKEWYEQFRRDVEQVLAV